MRQIRLALLCCDRLVPTRTIQNIQSYLSVLVFRVLVERRKVVSKWEGNRKWKSMDGQRQPQSLANIPQKVRFALYIHFKDRYADILSFDKFVADECNQQTRNKRNQPAQQRLHFW
ncbi:hypothetical protein BLNAU_24845 [Blattamonas nauphoetae]|uniref:Uncharacterized protein n=1 Tax=Blattamonas nauphoetae TaxID=2049346 RepID=A0ABQ9WP55_9EUKA|nr:hypothetical protein BLNAU_24845 [Blattamonas nauphoetae]